MPEQQTTKHKQQTVTLQALAHLEVEPQAMLGAQGVLLHAYVILQAIVRRTCKADVAALEVTAEGELA